MKIVNGQITDSVTQSNSEVLAGTPAVAGGNLMMITSHALSMSVQNALTNQQQSNLNMQSVTAQNIGAMTSIDTAVIERVDEDILGD